jgi:hypothetical protein
MIQGVKGLEDKLNVGYSIAIACYFFAVICLCICIICRLEASISDDSISDDSIKATAYKQLWINEHNLNELCMAVNREKRIEIKG